MRVFIVWGEWEYDGSPGPNAVFSTLEKALTYAKSEEVEKHHTYWNLNISGAELDDTLHCDVVMYRDENGSWYFHDGKNWNEYND